MTSSDRDHPPLLLPTPRTMRMVGGCAKRPAWLDAAVNGKWAEVNGAFTSNFDTAGLVIDTPGDRHHPEYYQLTISGDGEEARVAIRGHKKGVRRAVATLLQILRQFPGDLPCLEIEDEPGFSIRGVMLDISRDKVPTMAELRKTIDLFAELKFNHLQLYTEHTFAYVGHEDAWRGASPITPAEASELAAYCAARGIDLCPNQNCFGHLAHWLKLPRYQHLAEIEGDGAWKFMHWERRGPFSLCPIEPRAEVFVRDLLGQLLPCFSSSLVNIGCDETFDVGWGRSRAEVQRRAAGRGERAESDARAELYFEFVAKIARACEERGKRPMMWADIAISHPEMLHLMPPGMIGLAWCYEPTDKFEHWIGLLREHGHEAWVCPGTSSWRSFTGRTTERRGNIADAAEQGMRAGATGFLVCDWGDLGHRQQWPIALAGIAQAAEAAWNPAKARSFDARATGVHMFGDPTGAIGTWLDDLGDVDIEVRRSAGITNATALFNELHPPVPVDLSVDDREIKASIDAWMRVIDRLDTLELSRPSLSDGGGFMSPGRTRESGAKIADGLVNRELSHTLKIAWLSAMHAVERRLRAVRPSFPADGLARKFEKAIEEHRALWMQRSRTGGLDHSCSYYQQVIADLNSGIGK